MFQLPGQNYLYSKQDTDFLQLLPAFDGARIALNLSLHTQYGDSTEQQAIDLTANVFVSSQQSAAYNEVPFLTTVRAEDMYHTSATPSTVKLLGHISAAALREVEEERGHGDLYVFIRDLRGVLVDRPPTKLFQSQRGNSLTVRVRAGEWAEQLEAVTDASYIDILVPVTEDPDLAIASRRLRKARALIRRGEYDACAAELRQALDPVRAFYNTVTVYGSALQAPRKDRTEQHRYALVVQDMFNWLTVYVHDDEESIKGATMDRAAAVHALSVVAGIVHRLAYDKAASGV